MFIEVKEIDTNEDIPREILINIHHIRYLRKSFFSSMHRNACRIYVTTIGDDVAYFTCNETYDQIKNKIKKTVKERGGTVDRFDLLDLDNE
jgi:hypothetical protein